MRIKWKFEKENEDFDGYGNLKSYYKDSEPWKKTSPKPNIYHQILKVIFVLILCAVVILLGFSLQEYYGYDWNQIPGVRAIREVLNQRVRM